MAVVGGTDAFAVERAWANEGFFKKGLSKYIKTKKLDPLEELVPSILLSRDQIESVDGLLTVDTPIFNEARLLLRTGVTATLRHDARAVAQYAAEAGEGMVAEKAVADCILALERLDSKLLAASRSQATVSVAPLRESVASAVDAIDALLGTVPTEILRKAEVDFTAYRQAMTAANSDDPQQAPQQEQVATDLRSGSESGTGIGTGAGAENEGGTENVAVEGNTSSSGSSIEEKDGQGGGEDGM